MFWEVWRNVTSATTNWSLGGGGGGAGTSSGGGGKKGVPSSSSSSAHKTRYNRLNGRPTKSQSQPANLTSLQTFSSSSESLAGGNGDDDNEDELRPHHHQPAPLPLLAEVKERNEGGGGGRQTDSTQDFVGLESHFSHNPANNTGNLRKSKKSNGMKHSFSSFFPFTSCATTTSASSPPPAPTTINTAGGESSGKSDLDHQQQKEGHPLQNGSSSPMTNGNGRVVGGEAACWDHVKKEMGPGIYNNENDEEISDLDDEVEHLTCDVCERAFPTLKLLARHQRKKRHYGCLQCDSIFPSREVLECHREQMCHYDYAIDVYDEDEDDENFFESDDDEHGLRDCDEDCDDEERERLL